MSIVVMSSEELARSLSIRDLTDPEAGPHAIQQIVSEAVAALAESWSIPVRTHRAHAVVTVADNYDSLHYPKEGIARDSRYTRYVGPDRLLRTQTSAMIPPLMRALSRERAHDVLLVCPGIVYRRDTIDRLHSGEPHQVDLWRLARVALDDADLRKMAHIVSSVVAPGRELRCTPSPHPYTERGIQLDVRVEGEWVEIGECGIASPRVLSECGLGKHGLTGLAMGIGLDRCLMIRKGVPDIRLLRSAEPRVARQMLDLLPWVPVSSMPAVARDLSIAVACAVTPEELGDRVRLSLGDASSSVEEVRVVSETPHDSLPAVAIERLGMSAAQKNVLLRVVLRDLERTLTHDEANALRDAIYEALHEGTRHMWARGQPPASTAK